MQLAVPACHEGFTIDGGPGAGLRLEVRGGPLHSTAAWESIYRDGDTWQLWRDSARRLIFVPPPQLAPSRQVIVDTTFSRGEVRGEFGATVPREQAIYPLENIDMRLCANWFAETGDLIVHAAGIDDGGTGYAFVGPSGAGKSTVADALVTNHSVRVLGEDQVIVRHHEDRFLLYGTPWHTNPARCSPGGVPLRKLFFLDRAGAHAVERCDRRVGIERLLQNSLIPYYSRTRVERILDKLGKLAEDVPFYTLGFEIGADVIGLIRGA